MRALMDIALRTEVNAFVIDIKDASGYISHHTDVPLAHAIGATGEIRIPDLRGLLDRLEAERVYPIARITIVQDPILAKYRPELAVQDTAGGVWVDSKGIVWLNAFDRRVWDYHVAIAREVALMGFPEIQFDYVRFPDAPEEDMARAVFVGADGRSKAAAIRELLAHARSALQDLDVQFTADVFGVTTSAARDVGIGQLWESFIDRVDVALPMVYPSHYWRGSYGFQVPNAHPYEVVLRALRDAQRRSERCPLSVPDLGLQRGRVRFSREHRARARTVLGAARAGPYIAGCICARRAQSAQAVEPVLWPAASRADCADAGHRTARAAARRTLGRARSRRDRTDRCGADATDGSGHRRRLCLARRCPGSATEPRPEPGRRTDYPCR
jgi:hypothetical protein